MDFDIRTLGVAGIVVIWSNAVITLIACYYIKTLRRVIAYWSASQFLLGSSLILFYLRGTISDLFSIIVANALVMASNISIQEGIANYVNKSGYLRKWTFITLYIYIFIIFILTYYLPSVSWRIIAYSVSSVYISFITILTLYNSKQYKTAPPIKCLKIILFLNITLMLFRALVAAVEGQYPDLMQAGSTQAVIIICIFGIYTTLSLCLFGLITYRLNLKIQEQAFTDALTGLANRRAMNETLKSIRLNDNATIGIIMIDVDKFKVINDTFGHQAGDLYLRELSHVLKINLQEMDEIFRYAGDEFIAIVQNITSLHLAEIAERLSKKVENLSVSWHGQSIRTTISIGIAVTNSLTDNLNELIQQADDELYKVKKIRKR